MFHKAVEGAPQGHQAQGFVGMCVGNGAGQDAMLDIPPLCHAALLQPGIQGREARKARQRLPQPAPGILDVLLDLALLPARGRIAELRLKQVVAGHGREPGIDLPGLARSDPVDSRLHVVEDAPPRDPAQDPECLGQGIEQHLVGLQQIRPHDEGLAVRQLGVRHLQLDPFTAQHRPVFAPVKLEGLSRGKGQRHKCTAPARLCITLAFSFPGPHKGRYPAVGADVAQRNKVGVDLLRCAALLSRLARLHPEPRRQLLGKRVEVARPVGNLELRLHGARPQVLADRIARQSCPPLDLPDRHPLAEMPTSDNAQKCHVDHSMIPRSKCQGEGQNMGQFSVETCAPPGSTLSANQQRGLWRNPDTSAGPRVGVFRRQSH